MPTMKRRQVILNVYLSPEVYDALLGLSKHTGAPMAHFVRQGVEHVLAEHGVKVQRTKSKR